MLGHGLERPEPAPQVFRAGEAELHGEFFALEARRRYEGLAALAGARLEPVRSVPFVANHGALSHLVARLDLRQVGVLSAFPEQEPSPRDLRAIVETIRSTGARAVLAEPQTSPRFAEVVARETGIAVAIVDPLGGGDGAGTYSTLILDAVSAIREALGGGGDADE